MASAGLFASYPPAIDPQREDWFKTAVNEWALSHGLAVRLPQAYAAADPAGLYATPAPVTLYPSLLPRSCFDEAVAIQRGYNDLYAAVASDEPWLAAVVKELIPIDDFIAKLWHVHLNVKAEGYAQDLTLGLFRSDYMVHVDKADPAAKPALRQVEFNTIASSFGGLSTQVSALHRYLAREGAYRGPATVAAAAAALPPNQTSLELARGLNTAHERYAAKSDRPRCILFITQPGERNVFDQKHLEFHLIESFGCRVFRLAFSDVLKHTTVQSPQRWLSYRPPEDPETVFEVSTVYLRSGYAPSEYESADFDAWSARLQLERSAAIKCPTVLTQLAGTKKVQQILATPDSPHLARFTPEAAAAARVKATFAPMYPLDAETAAGKEGRRLATTPETAARHVLKPQREGGGNNIYRSAIPAFLKGIPQEQWGAYVLMEMIEPPPQRNIILRHDELEAGSVICELGVYGSCLWRQGAGDAGNEIFESTYCGFLLRTKGDTSEEGGVAAGFGAIDSPCLV